MDNKADPFTFYKVGVCFYFALDNFGFVGGDYCVSRQITRLFRPAPKI